MSKWGRTLAAITTGGASELYYGLKKDDKENSSTPAEVRPTWNAEKLQWEDAQGNVVTDLAKNSNGYMEDPLYRQSQYSLFPFGSNILKGNVPDYYKSIGETGSPEFNDMLGLTLRDTTNSVNESLAKRNLGRSGLAASIIGKQAADTSTNLRWADYNRALTGKQFLLGTGLNTLQNVGQSALTNQSNQNNYSLNLGGLNLAQDKFSAEKEAMKNQMWADILSSAISAGGTAYGLSH